MPSLIPQLITNHGQPQVDYLSYHFDPLDLHSCWKNATRNKKSMINGRRLENACWRRFFQLKFNLKTINPAQLNWHKGHDVQWLYGPLFDHRNIHELEQDVLAETKKMEVELKSALKKRGPAVDMLNTIRRMYLKRRAVSDLDSFALPYDPSLPSPSPVLEESKRASTAQKRKTLIRTSKSLTNLSKLCPPDTATLRCAMPSCASPVQASATRPVFEEDDDEEEETASPNPISLHVIPKGVDKNRWVQSHLHCEKNQNSVIDPDLKGTISFERTFNPQAGSELLDEAMTSSLRRISSMKSANADPVPDPIVKSDQQEEQDIMQEFGEIAHDIVHNAFEVFSWATNAVRGMVPF